MNTMKFSKTHRDRLIVAHKQLIDHYTRRITDSTCLISCPLCDVASSKVENNTSINCKRCSHGWLSGHCADTYKLMGQDTSSARYTRTKEEYEARITLHQAFILALEADDINVINVVWESLKIKI